jgi:hypothetical protein
LRNHPELLTRGREVSRQIGTKWKSLQGCEKSTYITMATEDKKRYDREVRSQVKPLRFMVLPSQFVLMRIITKQFIEFKEHHPVEFAAYGCAKEANKAQQAYKKSTGTVSAQPESASMFFKRVRGDDSPPNASSAFEGSSTEAKAEAEAAGPVDDETNPSSPLKDTSRKPFTTPSTACASQPIVPGEVVDFSTERSSGAEQKTEPRQAAAKSTKNSPKKPSNSYILYDNAMRPGQ